MPAWEYKVVQPNLKTWGRPESAQELLNDLGREGWELTPGAAGDRYLVFRREVEAGPMDLVSDLLAAARSAQ